MSSKIGTQTYNNSNKNKAMPSPKIINLQKQCRKSSIEAPNYSQWYPKNYKKKHNRKGSASSCESISNDDTNTSKNASKNPSPIKNHKAPYKSSAFDFRVKYKTELCKFYEIDGYCKFGEHCAYAHGKENLRTKVTNTTAYRTKNCTQFFEKGYCPYGNRCQFAHQLQSNILNNPYEKNMSYTKLLSMISKLENVDNIKVLFNKPRLDVFKKITKNHKEDRCSKSTLLDDIKELKCEGY